ncbi:MAG: ATP-binding protein [Oscillospiraceae bacterium]|nr:ATP-binding protein [Oscillospiraceae bacterium]
MWRRLSCPGHGTSTRRRKGGPPSAYAKVEFDALFAGKNSLTPLESVELFLTEQQRLHVLKQNLLHRKRANLPAEKTLDSFDFGFQRSVSREQMLRLSGMTWVEQAFHICFLGPPGAGKTHLALSLAVQGLDPGYAVAFETLDNLMTILKTAEISSVGRHLHKTALVVVDAWAGFLGSVAITTAILDRVLHHCTVINIRGGSYRLKE